MALGFAWVAVSFTSPYLGRWVGLNVSGRHVNVWATTPCIDWFFSVEKPIGALGMAVAKDHPEPRRRTKP